MKKISVVVSVTAAIAALGLFELQPASSHFAPSRLSFHVSDHSVRPRQRIVFFGRLHQVHGRCRRGATIELVRKGKGVVARNETDGQGEYRFVRDPKPNHGRFFARYRGRGRFGYSYGYGGTHRCGAARSVTRRIHRARR